MPFNFFDFESLLDNNEFLNLISKYNIGIEREALRVTQDGLLSKKSHPKALGKSLTHENITTDFSEAQIEIKTDVFTDIELIYDELVNLHTFIYQKMDDDELFWNASMPSRLPHDDQIPIATFGDSAVGQFKHIYREGLKNRYGKKMQTISGIHFNFSFHDDLIKFIHEKSKSADELNLFRSEFYLHVSRNLLRLEPFTTYFFGISPTGDETFFEDKNDHDLSYATSLRMSNLGYSNEGRCRYDVSYNSMNLYVSELDKVLNTSCHLFEKIGLKENDKHKQLNTNILQIEAEYYSTVRPKNRHVDGERPIDTLKREGVSYVEFRGIDINPINKVGIDKDDIYFLHLIFLYSLFLESPSISKNEKDEIDNNQGKISKEGRKENIKITSNGVELDFKEYCLKKLDQFESIAQVLKGHPEYKKYIEVIEKKRSIIKDSRLTPAGVCVEHMISNKISYLDCILELSKLNKRYFENIEIDSEKMSGYNDLVKKSFDDQKKIEMDKISLEDYMREYFNS